MNEGQMKDLMKLVWGADPINNTNPRNVGDLLENTLNNNTTAITNALQNNLNAINALTTANQNRTTSKVLLNKATQGEALAARYQINYYINGLKPFLVGQVVIGNTDTLEATITRAKLVELGVNTTLLTTTPVTTSTAEPIPTTTTTTVKPAPQVDGMEALTKQMQQLALNYANLSSVLMV
ncbi:unnamed protein product [Rhizophagus irregularis]|nr:unnamed protein product [Rhizophagus irregularis]CAB5190523.1 unnamed protein product [Rhizophagus irregularis]